MGPIQKQFENVLRLFKKHKVKFALAGGYAASIYRAQERFTKDIDFIIYTEGNVIHDAKEILKELGLNAFEIREAQLRGGPPDKIKEKTTPIWMVAGRGDTREDVPVDFLLHQFPWMRSALDRAQANEVNIGFGWKIPVLTAEDTLLSKFMALSDKSDRIDDLSDIKEIFSHTKIDLPYLIGQMKILKIRCPKSANKFVPKVIRMISREIT